MGRVNINFVKMPLCPYMVKTFKILLQNEKLYDLETWHAALRTVLTLTYFLFYSKVKFGHLCV